MSEEIITFDKALEKAEGTKHLLLGNGFSMGFDKEAFDYSSLKEMVPDKVKKVFVEFPDIVDFEHLLKISSDAEKIINVVCNSDDNISHILKKLKKNGDNLKKALIKALADKHPINPTTNHPRYNEITARYQAASNFRNKFCKVFTLNYDLILYHSRLSATKTFYDGFSGSETFGYSWSLDFLGNKERADVFFLHGALHLNSYENEEEPGKVYKKSPRVSLEYESEPKRIIEQVNEWIGKGEYPLAVVAGESKDKENFIVREPYLRWCYEDHFKKLEGSLFIYGCSFDDKDDHIYLNISKDISHLFIGVYDKKPDEDKIAKIRQKNSNLEITSFCSRSANVWGKGIDL